MITASTAIREGIATSMITDRPASSRTAKTMPKSIVIGAAIIIVQASTNQHLNLLDVVGDAGDQRRCAEVANFALGVAVDLPEDVAPNVASEAHRGTRSIADGSDGKHDLDEAEPEHYRAPCARCNRCRP